MEKTINRQRAFLTTLAALLVQVLTWFVLYPLAGYNERTLLVAQLAFLALGIGLAQAFSLGWREIGAGAGALVRAAGGMLAAYGLLLAALLLGNALGAALPLFRTSYRPDAWLNNWLLTGFGEELVFAGVLFNLLDRAWAPRRRWAPILLTALLFALWHLPGYLAVGLRLGTLGPGLVFDLLLRALSWGFFGAIYCFSGNLWLTAFAHASTDYPLLPAITASPFAGLVFMGMLLFVGRVWGRCGWPAANHRDSEKPHQTRPAEEPFPRRNIMS